MQGIITKNISNDYTISADEKEYICKARGKFRKEKITPLVGDKCIFDEQKKYIIEILPRKTELVRPPIANIDQAVIITSVKEPDFSSNLLDKLLCIIEYNNITPIICFTKLDLLNSEETKKIEKIIEYYKKIGYKVYKNTEIEGLKQIFKNKITVFTGQSGAGKSTLLNKLNIKLNLKTNEISKALGRGKHTTRHVELINMLNGLIADTPGFSSINFNGMTNEDIRDSFIEFNKYRDKCEYKDCMHISESNCEIKKELEQKNILESRYENYIKFQKR
jgi:ribosome biogenesis GTPase